MAGGALAEPKTNMLHQWDSGSDAAAIAKLGEMFTAAGGKWEQTSIAGHTANTLAKLRADVIAGNAPLTLNATKQALARLQRRLSRDEGEDLILMCYMSRDFREGLDAFLNKRPPQWAGE